MDLVDTVLSICRQSYATSLSSSVTNYQWQHGRRFHSYKEGSKSGESHLDACDAHEVD